MRKPDQICRVCKQLPSSKSLGDVCSNGCAERLSETEYYELELGEAVAELNAFEEGVYLPLHIKLTRAEARLRILEVGMAQLSRSDHMAEGPGDPLEVREWKKDQLERDKWAMRLAQRLLRRLGKRVRELERDLREIDLRWQTLADRKEATLEKLSRARGE